MGSWAKQTKDFIGLGTIITSATQLESLSIHVAYGVDDDDIYEDFDVDYVDGILVPLASQTFPQLQSVLLEGARFETSLFLNFVANQPVLKHVTLNDCLVLNWAPHVEFDKHDDDILRRLTELDQLEVWNCSFQ